MGLGLSFLFFVVSSSSVAVFIGDPVIQGIIPVPILKIFEIVRLCNNFGILGIWISHCK